MHPCNILLGETSLFLENKPCNGFWARKGHQIKWNIKITTWNSEGTFQQSNKVIGKNGWTENEKDSHKLQNAFVNKLLGWTVFKVILVCHLLRFVNYYSRDNIWLQWSYIFIILIHRSKCFPTKFHRDYLAKLNKIDFTQQWQSPFNVAYPGFIVMKVPQLAFNLMSLPSNRNLNKRQITLCCKKQD